MMGLWERKEAIGMGGEKGSSVPFTVGSQGRSRNRIIGLGPSGIHSALFSKGLDPEAAEDA